MKKANKVILGLTALVTAFSVCSLTACGNNTETGAIAGNYQEATSEDMTTALSKIESDKMAGDPTAADYKFGVELASELKANIDLGSYGSFNMQFNEGYKCLTTKDTVTGAGSSSMKLDMTTTENNQPKTTKYDASLNLYNDAEYMYLDVTADNHNEDTTDDVAVNCKFNYMDLVEYIASLGGISGMPDMPAALADEAPTTPAAPTTPDLPSQLPDVDALTMLNTLGVKSYVDTKDGVKLKFSATEDTVWNILALSGEVEASAIVVLKQAVTFNSFKLDAYFAIDKAGLFSAASVVMDIDAKVDMNAINPGTAKAEEKLDVYSAKISGYFKVSAYTGEAPELPKLIEYDAKYADMTETVKETIGSLIGGQLPEIPNM